MDEDKAEFDDDLDEVEEPEVEEPEEEEIDTEAETDDVVVSINGESPDPEDEKEVSAPGWVRDLRTSYRDDKRRSKKRSVLTRIRGLRCLSRRCSSWSSGHNPRNSH